MFFHKYKITDKCIGWGGHGAVFIGNCVIGITTSVKIKSLWVKIKKKFWDLTLLLICNNLWLK